MNWTRALLASVPQPGRRADRDPSPTVCCFLGRCPDGFERCEREMPALRSDAAGHAIACHLHG